MPEPSTPEEARAPSLARAVLARLDATAKLWLRAGRGFGDEVSEGVARDLVLPRSPRDTDGVTRAARAVVCCRY